MIGSLPRDELAMLEVGSWVECDLWAENDQPDPLHREGAVITRACDAVGSTEFDHDGDEDWDGC